MQQYIINSQSNNMAAYDDDSRYSFNGTQQESISFSRSCSDVNTNSPTEGAAGRNMMLNFGGVMDRIDPSASFPGLGELPSNGMEPAVEQNLTGTFTGDLNSTAYEVHGDHQDHSRLLQEMLQLHPPPQPQARLPADAHSQVPAEASHGDWEDSLHVLQEMVHLQQQQQQAHQIYNQTQMEQAFHQNFTADRYRPTAPFNGNSKFTGESDLLNLLQFPRGSTTTSANIPSNFGYTTGNVRAGKGPLYNSTCTNISGPVNTNIYDPVLNHHFQNSSGSQRYNNNNFHRRDVAPEGANNSRHGGAILVDLDQERDQELNVAKSLAGNFGSKREHAGAQKGGEPARGVNHFATERQRREFLNEKYHTLRSLVPNPTKADRASIVADAIEYVKELKRRVQELQQFVQEKRRSAGDASSVKRRRSSMDATTEAYNNTVGSSSLSTLENNNSNQLVMQKSVDSFISGGSPGDGQLGRCSWLQKTSLNGTHVDVRIVHDEVTIKVNQQIRRRVSKHCLLFDAIAVLQDLQLDLVQASGATVGEHDVFLFNTKILEGSSTYAGYIAVKLLDALDRHLVI